MKTPEKILMKVSSSAPVGERLWFDTLITKPSIIDF